MKRILAIAFLAFSTLVLTPASQATMLLRYVMNEGSGSSTANSGSLGGSANLSGTGAWTSPGVGIFTSALGQTDLVYPSSDNDFIARQDSLGGAFNTMSAYTITGWFNLAGDISTTNFTGLFTTKTNTDQNGVALWIRGDGSVNMHTTGDNFRLISGLNTTAGSGWQFFALTINGTNANFYLGSVTSAPTAVVSDSTIGAAYQNGTVSSIMLGGQNTGWGIAALPGWMNDVRFYDEALSASAINGIRLEAVPEPSTYALLGLGLGTLLWLRRRAAKPSA